MATQEEANYTKLVLLLTKPCRNLMAKVLQKSVHENYDQSVDTFVNINRSRIEKTPHGKLNYDRYFPRQGVTNVNEWDISMLHFVITFCPVPSISTDLRNIKNLRNALAHPGKVLISSRDYRPYHKEIQNFIKGGLKYLCDPISTKKISEDVSRINEMIISKDTVDLLRDAFALYMGHFEEKIQGKNL